MTELEYLLKKYGFDKQEEMVQMWSEIVQGVGEGGFEWLPVVIEDERRNGNDFLRFGDIGVGREIYHYGGRIVTNVLVEGQKAGIAHIVRFLFLGGSYGVTMNMVEDKDVLDDGIEPWILGLLVGSNIRNTLKQRSARE